MVKNYWRITGRQTGKNGHDYGSFTRWIHARDEAEAKSKVTELIKKQCVDLLHMQ